MDLKNFRDYQDHEFCKDINCPFLNHRKGICKKNSTQSILTNCIATAKDFHKWIEKHNGKILIEEK